MFLNRRGTALRAACVWIFASFATGGVIGLPSETVIEVS